MASSASNEQCTFRGGRPSKASVTERLVMAMASCTVLPITISVEMEEVATAAPHQKVLNLASFITPLSSMSR